MLQKPFHLSRASFIYWSSVILLTSILLFLFFYQLNGVWINDYDEARHGVNAYEMTRSGDYLVNTYQGEPDTWNLKPPLSFWLIALAYCLFGFNAFALRFFSVLSTISAIGAIAVWAGRNVHRWAAPLMLLLFAACNMLYGLHFSRYGDADAQYQLFFTLAVLCSLNASRNFRWWYLAGLCFELAFLEKGMHAANVVLVCFAIFLLNGQWKRLTWKRVALILLSGTVLIVPWTVARYLRDGGQYFTQMISTDVVARLGTEAYTEDIAAKWPAFLFYFSVFIRSPSLIVCLLASAVSGCVLLAAKVKLTLAVRNAIVGCALWLLLPLFTYGIANVKYIWYGYSALFALPALTCVMVFAAMQVHSYRKVLIPCLAIGLAAFAVCMGVNLQTVASFKTGHTVQDFIREDLDRTVDEGTHTYIQFSTEPSTVWMQGDMLVALFAGDVQCIDGGVQGYLEDEESAIVYILKENNQDTIDALLEQEAVRNENYYLIAFEK
jgi:4-amino-4-deoxy-L-arabinose transferase-like glycosyltransferase